MRRTVRPTIWSARQKLAVGLAAMTDAIERDGSRAVINGEQRAVVPNPEAIPLAAGELLNLGMPRFESQRLNAAENRQPQRVRDAAQVFLNAPVVEESVHGLDESLPFEALEQFVVGNERAGGADGLSQRARVIAILGKPEQFPIVEKRQDDRRRFSASVHNEALRLDLARHRFLQISYGSDYSIRDGDGQSAESGRCGVR